ncbi:nucleotide sugar dehydrogenase [Desulforamulus aquiferis]|uniref:Nucleotide sugar dehydrogenase n=1 Tax=Desulforamulus aquiferis TaxID=1397668 RepID=A0AAW7ZAZ7_9FIRM|nr:nucleotide sugar dehydrogenase [Desulforamulus aquiferis]MDO7786857.1 nucleotide sugar dehydrogenase [Desulforamulus aquiferis]RYD01262.1 hypothetical protein N752_30160 [Desulforamulus aquiferis]
MKICVVGLGYIGLPTAGAFAEAGAYVHGVDINEELINKVSKGENPYVEPGLDELIKKVIGQGMLTVGIRPIEADVFIIAVPTPCTSDHKADLSYCHNAMKAIKPYLRKGNLIILESTVYPGATKEVVLEPLKKKGFKPGKDVYIAHCPERVIPGKIIEELVNNYRVIGGINEKSAEKAKELYSLFVKGEIYTSDIETAEMVKLMENTFRDVNIALANEMAKICNQIGINAWEAIGLANKHPRVNLHQPGPGVGGHCIAVDPYFVIESAPEQSKLIKTARQINRNMPKYVLEMVQSNVIPKKKVAILGLSYKANIDDTRESPSIEIVELLRQKGYIVSAHDPFVEDSAGLKECLYNADCVVITVDHDSFKTLNPEMCEGLMANQLVIDTKNTINHREWREAGFQVLLLGDGQPYNLGVEQKAQISYA